MTNIQFAILILAICATSKEDNEIVGLLGLGSIGYLLGRLWYYIFNS